MYARFLKDLCMYDLLMWQLNLYLEPNRSFGSKSSGCWFEHGEKGSIFRLSAEIKLKRGHWAALIRGIPKWSLNSFRSNTHITENDILEQGKKLEKSEVPKIQNIIPLRYYFSSLVRAPQYISETLKFRTNSQLWFSTMCIDFNTKHYKQVCCKLYSVLILI